jgi:hypothetical protein
MDLLHTYTIFIMMAILKYYGHLILSRTHHCITQIPTEKLLKILRRENISLFNFNHTLNNILTRFSNILISVFLRACKDLNKSKQFKSSYFSSFC